MIEISTPVLFCSISKKKLHSRVLRLGKRNNQKTGFFNIDITWARSLIDFSPQPPFLALSKNFQ